MSTIFKIRCARIPGGLSATLLFSAAACAQSPVEQAQLQVRNAEAARSAALVTADIEKLKAMTATDYIHVESNGKLRNRDEFLQGLIDSDYRFKSFIIDRMHINIQKDIAIATGDYHNDIITNGAQQPTKYARFTRVWKLMGGSWINLTHQATEYKKLAP